jgi:hypothetical protein
MNTRHSLIASALVAAFAASPAFAQEATPDTWTDIASTTTRAEVRADAAAALRAGEIERGEASSASADFRSLKTREQVRAEAVAAMRLGLIGHGERSAPSFTPAQAESIRQAGLDALSVPMAQATR